MRIEVLGVPDSSGAYCVGVERAPAALRAAGLLDSLAAAGCDVRDNGDLTTRRWSPDPVSPRAQNRNQQVAAAVELAEAASGLVSADARLLLLGGSCVIAVGLCAALRLRGSARVWSTWIGTST